MKTSKANNNTPISCFRIPSDAKADLQKIADLHFNGNLTKLLIEAGLNYEAKEL